MRRRLVVREIAIVAVLAGAWWVALLVLPTDGTWHAARLGADAVLSVLILAGLFRLWRHLTGQENAWDGAVPPPTTSGEDRRPPGPPQSMTTGTVPHH